MVRSDHSFDDRQAHAGDRLHRAVIDPGYCKPSFSRLAAAIKSGRIEQLIFPRSDRHTRGLRTWQ
jgi:hypothetical protein